MKVLAILPTPWSMSFGGLDVQFEQTVRHLKKRGVDMITIDYFDPNLLKDVDLVHFFGFGPMYYHIGRILNGKDIPYVVSTIYYSYGKRHWMEIIRGRILGRLPETSHKLNSLFLSSAKCYLPNSNAEALQLVSVFGLDASKIVVTPNAVDKDFIGNSESFAINYLPKSFPKEFVLSVSRIVPRKNTLNLVSAAIQADVPLVLVGPKVLYGPPGSSERIFVEKVDQLMRSKPDLFWHIEHLASSSVELASAYAAAKTHALVSILETPGLATLEAGLNGCNLVVGHCPPVIEYVGDISMTVSQTSVDEIASALDISMSQSRNNRGQATYIANRYTWDHTASITYYAYEKALST